MPEPASSTSDDYEDDVHIAAHSSNAAPQAPKRTSTSTTGTKQLNGDSSNGAGHHYNVSNGDTDAQTMVISSLRSQVQDLYTQVSQLNAKLVQSYDRVSDLEDDLHVASATIRSSNIKVSQLELERTQHLSALNTGLLVEKSHVTAELTRLMEKATEEAAQRGQAESARTAIEKDLDDLSATLFGQANTMVAEARFAQNQSEEKVKTAETALKGAEEAVALMQAQMQDLQSQKEDSERTAQNLRLAMGKGKWVDRSSLSSSISIPRPKLLSSHVPYQEFLLFVAHLRSVHSSSSLPPAMSTLLPLSFLARILVEDSEPALRLDFAPSLNWLSRRSVLAAIHNGQLTVEPMSTLALLQEPTAANSHSPLSAFQGYNSSTGTIGCSLCGTAVLAIPPEVTYSHKGLPSASATNALSSISRATATNASWFKNPLSSQATNSPPATPTPMQMQTPASSSNPTQIYIFRLSTAVNTTTTTIAAPTPLPASSLTTRPGPSTSISTTPNSPSRSTYTSQQSSTHARTVSQTRSTTIYPLCTNNWCLSRLRTTCSLWAFIRTGVVEKVWEEEVPTLLPPPSHPSTTTAVGSSAVSALSNSILGKPPTLKRAATSQPDSSTTTTTTAASGDKPPVPPRRRGLWSMASALGERAASWGDNGNDKKKDDKTLPAAPPPTHPAIKSNTTEATKHTVPPLPPSMVNGSEAASAPPPLPRRNENRSSPTSSPAHKDPPAIHASDSHTGAIADADHPAVDELRNRKSIESELMFSVPPDSPPAHATTFSPVPIAPKRSSKRLSTSVLEAAKVPLPDSRPGTPSTPTGIAPPRPPPRRDLEGGLPSRTTSPGPGGAPPPPLPRRAAARSARPLSSVGVPLASPPIGGHTGLRTLHRSPSKDNMGLPSSPPKQSEKPAVEADQKVEIADESATEVKTGGNDPAGAAVVEGETRAESEDSTKEADVKRAPVDTTEPATQDSSEGSKETTTTSVEEQAQSQTTTEAAPAIDFSAGEGAREMTESASEPTHALRSSEDESSTAVFDASEPASKPSADVKAAAVELEGEGEEDIGAFIGERTWEERTWKELVRLREEMFWARVGAFRPTQA